MASYNTLRLKWNDGELRDVADGGGVVEVNEAPKAKRDSLREPHLEEIL